MAHFRLFSLILLLLCSLSVVTTVLLLQVRKSFIATHSSSFPIAQHVDERKKYSFIHDDFPNAPVFETENVLMNVEESMHYQVHGTEAIQEWDALDVLGLGSVTFGKDYRTFYLPVFHQLHCLKTFRKALDEGSKFRGSKEHMNHCFSYFRQWTMCDADLTLEPGDFMARNFTRDRTGMTHVCKAWDKVYLQTAMNWVKWAKYWAGPEISKKNRTMLE